MSAEPKLTYPDDLLYSADHNWIRRSEDRVRIGITDYAQEMLGEIVFVSLTEVGAGLVAGQPLGELEAMKAAVEISAPVSGTVTAVNWGLEEAPERINDDPYGDGWLIEVLLTDPRELDALLDATAYGISLES